MRHPSRLTLTTLFAASLLLALPAPAQATPAWQSKAPRAKTVRTQHKSASRQYVKAKNSRIKYQKLTRKQMKLYKRTGNVKQKAYAQKNAIRAGRAKVRMISSQVKGLKAKAKLAIKSGNPDKANQYLDKAAKLEKSAKTLSTKLDKAEARFAATGSASGRSSAGAGGTLDGPEMGGSSSSSQQPDGENPLTQGDKRQRLPGVGSSKGKRMVKAQLESGNMLGAVETLKKMEAQPSRKGLMGAVDGYRKWSTKRKILKAADKKGRAAARSGDLQLAGESAEAMSSLRKPGWGTNRKINAIGNSALKSAKKMARTGRAEEARMMLDFARQIQASTGRTRPTLRFRMVRRTAERRVIKDLKSRANSGNMEAFRSAMRLASAYAKESGKPMKPGTLKQVRKLYMTAMKNSVPRALRDAQMMVSGKMGYVNVEEAANRFAYAYDTAQKLANRGVKVKTGSVLRGSLDKQFTKTRKMLVDAMQKQSSMAEVKRPGLMKRIYEKIFVAPHKRTQATVAPMDGKWMQQQQQQQQRAQELEMMRMQGQMQ